MNVRYFKTPKALEKDNILEEIKDLITEGEFAARDILIKTYYQIGRMIIENDLSPNAVSIYIGRSERLVQHMVKFASEPKILDKISKEESWHSIVQNRLTTHKELEEHQHSHISICSICHIRL